MLNVPNDPAYDKAKAKQTSSAKAKGVLRRAGYARGGGVAPERAVHKHEGHMHKGETKTKFKHGGKVDGKKAHVRADKYKRGGSVPKGHHTRININVGAGQQEKAQALKTGLALGAQMQAKKMAGGPRPGAGAPPMARPMPAPQMGGAPMPTGPGPVGPSTAATGGRQYKRGGKVGPARVKGVPHLKGGSGGAKGRLEKKAQYGTKPKK